MVPINPGAKPRIPRAPLAAGGRRLGHGAQALQLFEGPGPTGRQGWLAFFRQASGSAQQRGQTRWAIMDPRLRDAVAIAHQEALPRLDQGEEGFFGAVGMHERERHGVRGQRPQPVQSVMAVPGGVVERADGGLARQGGTGLRVGHEGLRGAVDQLWHRAQTERKVQDRAAAILDEAP